MTELIISIAAVSYYPQHVRKHQAKVLVIRVLEFAIEKYTTLLEQNFVKRLT